MGFLLLGCTLAYRHLQGDGLLMLAETCRLWLRWMWQPPSTACSSTSQHTFQWSSSLLAWKASAHRQSCLCAMQSTRTCTGTSCCFEAFLLHWSIADAGCIGALLLSTAIFSCISQLTAPSHAWGQPQDALQWVSSQAHSGCRCSCDPTSRH